MADVQKDDHAAADEREQHDNDHGAGDDGNDEVICYHLACDDQLDRVAWAEANDFFSDLGGDFGDEEEGG